ncbi:MAG: type II toxin-antitoxin system VapC family toxin [Janthinobacterium lividum]
MVKALFDTNILIDYLNGIDAARNELSRYTSQAISMITWMEILVGTTANDEAATRTWLNAFDVIPLDSRIANEAVRIRQQKRIRLPDAIIWASARTHSLLLVSRNVKNFPENEPGVRVPYSI